MINTATKTWLELLRLLQEILNETAETTGEMIGNKKSNQIFNPKLVSGAKPSHWKNIHLIRAKARNEKQFKANIKWNISTILDKIFGTK